MFLGKGSLISGDAGHNCNPDKGGIGLLDEDECTKEVWNFIVGKLNKLGYRVKDCTPWDKNFNYIGESLKYRVEKTNESSSVLHLSIHFNCEKNKGVRCWISNFGGRSEKFANQICNEISKLGFYNGGVKTEFIYIVQYSNIPSVLVQCCCINSIEDFELYDADKISTSIVRAITGLDFND